MVCCRESVLGLKKGMGSANVVIPAASFDRLSHPARSNTLLCSQHCYFLIAWVETEERRAMGGIRSSAKKMVSPAGLDRLPALPGAVPCLVERVRPFVWHAERLQSGLERPSRKCSTIKMVKQAFLNRRPACPEQYTIL